MADFNTTPSGDIVLILSREEAGATLEHLRYVGWPLAVCAVRDALECVLRPAPSTQQQLDLNDPGLSPGRSISF